MTQLKLAAIFLVAAAFTGCITTSELIRQNTAVPETFSVSLLNGRYKNVDTANTYSSYSTLWSDLYFCKTFKNTTSGSAEAIVVLDYDNDKELKVTLVEDSIVVNQIELKVKRHGDYLSVRRHLLLIPIPFVWYRHHEAKMILFNDQSGFMQIAFARSQFVWTLMGASLDAKHNSVYDQLD